MFYRVALSGALLVGLAASPLFAAEIESRELTPLKAPVTSLGGAVAGDYLYIYGGHLGEPHKYSADLQAKQLLRLNLAKPGAWEVVGEGPRRTGLALVAHDGKLYRVGGWEAKNTTDDKWDLYSRPDLARFDQKSGQWKDLASLPTGRSSHDAAVLGSKLYVVGGWELSGKGDGAWHDTAFACDLAEENPAWKEIAKPPFRRRALAVAAFDGNVFAIGGMDESGETTTAVNVYHPDSNRWTEGPALKGAGAEGFGVSAFGNESGLYASTASGALYRLSADGKSWDALGKLQHARNFHRLLATADGSLVVVGGTSRGQGKVSQVELIRLPKRVATP